MKMNWKAPVKRFRSQAYETMYTEHNWLSAKSWDNVFSPLFTACGINAG